MIGLRPTLMIAGVGGGLGVLWVIAAPVRTLETATPAAILEPVQES